MPTDVDTIAEFFGQIVLNETICISLKNNYIYFEVPKSGSTSIMGSIHELELRPFPATMVKYQHPPFVHSPCTKPYQLSRQHLTRLLDDPNIFRFSFVRNPYSRTLSAYLDKILSEEESTSTYHRKELGLSLTGHIEFIEFLKGVADQTPKEMNKHWRPQVHQSMHRYCQLDFIGKVENFRKDFDQVQRRIGRGMKPAGHIAPHATHATARMREFYGAKEVDLVKTIYREDFDEFNYDLEGP